ncbi:MAG: radical SAM protein [Prolixibacteraceae bacterium]|jgi:wyosine [tRNA(Phe)-imidazoG37] synthetase (radical SAM superfamily)|nr:radical SAM protein [Prolixibacteraceae bacterium]MBT6007257.1 radical SAM protein [Prolixibacteraceae bacterium]MBT6766743.1 radical SAM protein [Prolixibacteraceae bacterium]MBT6998873.1 radical SAM protein [Prolixibacteraceae bacterium]MBT7397342.1 radical SAM protein [Prolixibacteraceae bacterium]
MATFLFDKIIFGPVKSRRLGVSLGVNLLPTNDKVCSFDCVYCECGRTPKKYEEKAILPSRIEVFQKLKKKLKEMAFENLLPDVITFAGNGEPTLHPEFAGIIEDTIQLRDSLSPKARIAVLSNATMLHKKEIFSALLKINDNIQKLDSAFEETIQTLDCPRGTFSLKKIVDQLMEFDGKVIIQTMFVRGSINGKSFDNTTEKEISAWIELLKKINPLQVMIYTIARDTPINTIEKISQQELNSIAACLEESGFNVQVSA